MEIEELLSQLAELRVERGDNVLVHAAMSAVKRDTNVLFTALTECVGGTGTVIVCNFAPFTPVELRESLPRWCTKPPGAFARLVSEHADSVSSPHSMLSFSALGLEADYITSNHLHAHPMGVSSPLDRLYQLDAKVLLLGVGLESCPLGFLAEAYADSPNSRRAMRVTLEDGTITEIPGAPMCSDGFPRMLPVLRQARIIRTGKVGDADSLSMSLRQGVSMGVEMLRGDAEALLCRCESCDLCNHARTFTRDPEKLTRRFTDF